MGVYYHFCRLYAGFMLVFANYFVHVRSGAGTDRII